VEDGGKATFISIAKTCHFFGFIFGLSRFGNGEQADWMNVRLLFSWEITCVRRWDTLLFGWSDG
jgi:hypothetical protein